jgi:hypothetical protein
MLPVLIIAYLRPENLERLLEISEIKKREIYIFIDGANETYSTLNNEVAAIAKKYSEILSVRIFHSNKNLGVDKAVPTAIDWAFNSCEKLIVIEDDCLPKEGALDYFDTEIDNISNKVCMVSGYGFELNRFLCNESRVSSIVSYPLIWGWATSKSEWNQVSTILKQKYIAHRIFLHLLKHPSKVAPLCFFWAAFIRVRRGKMKAWDALIALEMLLSNKTSILSLRPYFENIGDDLVASHVVSNSKYQNKGFYKSADKQIETEIYNLRFRNVLSPAKAYLGL